MFSTSLVLRPDSPRRVWYTPRGASGCAKRLYARLPADLSGYLMITLTVDPAKGAPFDVYESVRHGWRRFFGAIRKLWGLPCGCKLSWLRKMELQENGYPHWHLIIKLPRLAREKLSLVDETWGWGMTQVVAVKGVEAIKYLLKYVCKPVMADNGNPYGLPDWVLDYKGRIQWIYSSNFLTPDNQRDAQSCEEASAELEEEKSPKDTLRQRLERFSRTVEVLEVQHSTGDVIARQKINVAQDARGLLVESILQSGVINNPPWQDQRKPITLILQCPNAILRCLTKPISVYVSLAA